jgi:hypothetical protein
MPSWLPGDDYMTNFRVGDPYIKVDEGYARLPGTGYEAIHPELKGLDPEDYPDINKLAILGDVAPYSRQFHTYRQTRSLRPAGTKKLAHAGARELAGHLPGTPVDSACFAPPTGGPTLCSKQPGNSVSPTILVTYRTKSTLNGAASPIGTTCPIR